MFVRHFDIQMNQTCGNADGRSSRYLGLNVDWGGGGGGSRLQNLELYLANNFEPVWSRQPGTIGITRDLCFLSTMLHGLPLETVKF